MKKSGAGIIEYGLILLLVVIVTIASWSKISTVARNLTGLSLTKVNTHPTQSNTSSDELAALIKKIKAMIAKLDKNSPNYIKDRTDTTGALGGAFAKYGGSNAMLDLLRTFAAKDGHPLSETEANACAGNMSACETLMTVTDFSWSTPVAMSSVYNGGKITVSFKYTYSYVNNSGELVSAILDQGAYVQKEQNAGSTGKTYGSFLNAYMDKTYSKDDFTGSAVDVQTKIDDYLSGTNCELSKSDSQYVNFAQHSSAKK